MPAFLQEDFLEATSRLPFVSLTMIVTGSNLSLRGVEKMTLRFFYSYLGGGKAEEDNK